MVVALGLLAAGCSSSSDDDSAPTTSEAATTTEAVTPDTVDNPLEVDGDPRLDFTVPDPDPTPLRLDPAVRSGVLDNGLTYYVASNDSPGGKLEFRLAVDAGSLHQEVPDAGSAHFLEHMLFNGTEQFPELELDQVLRSFGMSIGPDINAYTWFDETVYQLSVPTQNPSAVTTAFDVIREWMTNVTLDPQAVIEERGVVREELRLRDESASGIINAPILAAYVDGSRYAGHDVSGTVERVSETTADDLRAFYEAWYRLDNMAVIVVGDLPAGDLERLVQDEFGPLAAPDDALEQIDRSLPDITEPIIDVVTHPEGPEPRISLDYALPHSDPSTVGGERVRLIEDVINSLMSLDLDTAATRGQISAIQPGGSTFEFVRERRFLGFNFGGVDQVKATEEVITRINGLLVNGFDEAALAQVAAEYAAALDQSVSSLESRQDAEIADGLVSHHLNGTGLDAVEATAERQRQMLDDITVDDLTNHLRYVMSRSAPIVIAFGNDPDDVDLDELIAAVERGIDAVPDRVETASAAVPGQDLMERPEPVSAVSVSAVAVEGIDAARIELANGVVVLFTESDISEGSVDLVGVSAGGYSVLDPGEGPLATLAASAVAGSGVGDFDAVELQTALSGSVASISPFVSLLEEGFSGSSSSDDIEKLFQLIYLGITDARIDDAAWAEASEQAKAQATYFETDPNGAAFVALFDARYGSTGYHLLSPDVDMVDATSPAEALALFEERFGTVDDLIVAIAGDIDLDTIVELSEVYLANLPEGPDDTWRDVTEAPPQGVVTRTVGAGVGGSGAGFNLLFTLPGEPNDQDRAAATLLQTILGERFFNTIREELGASYGGGSAFASVADPDEPGIELFISIDADPDRLDEVHARVLAELADVAAGIDQRDFDNALSVVLNELNFINNGSLLEELLTVGRDGSDAWTILRQYEAVATSTRSNVESLARRLLDFDNYVEVLRSAS